MAFTQKTFLGASIRGWTASIGYGSNESTMTVQLVEDATNGDIFTPVDPGTPVYFQYDNWIFGGLVQNIKLSGSQSGSPLYEVTLVDPRGILEGVHLILSNYNGSVSGLNNIFNIYGYLENLNGFGGADVNEAGIPYSKIVQGLSGIASSPGGNYGRFVSYKGYQYTIDLSNLPPIQSNYRVGGDSISLMEFVREICNLGGVDDSFFFRLETNGVIKLYVSQRNSNPVTGAITDFIINTPGAVSKSIGIEMRNQTTSKFLVGGNKEQIYLQAFNNDRVEPFWGVDRDNNAIIGFNNEDYDDVYQFTVDSRRINIPGMGPTYTMDIPELRAALDSRESWEAFLVNHNDVDGIHKGKADRFNIVGNIGAIKAFFDSVTEGLTSQEAIVKKLKNITPLEFATFSRDYLSKYSSNLYASDIDYVDDYIGNLYEFVHYYATQFYGKMFMVKIPYIYTFTESESGNVVVSQEPNDSGYIDEEYVEQAQALNILPEDSDALTTPENKYICYVRFDNAENLDLTEISPEDMVFNRTTIGRGNKRNSQGLSVFIKCSVDQKIVYQNYSTKFSPRVVVQLPGAVRASNGDERNRFNGIFTDILRRFLREKNIEDAFADIANTYSAKFGGDVLYYGIRGEAQNPAMLAIPLVSKIESYGPWYASGGDGKMDYQKDSSLVPWNYGGFSLMNLAGNAAVTNAISSQFVSEAGSIEFPDVPAINIGDLLIFGGPYVTDVDVKVGNDGATTTYRMQNWTPRFGKVPQSMVDRMQRIAIGQRRLKKEMLARNRPGVVDAGRIQRIFREYKQSTRRSHNSSHGLISGHITKDDDRSIISVFMQPAYNAIPQIADDYENKAIVTLDSLFVPFSTDVDHDGNLPHYETPESNQETFDYLNPYKGENILPTIIAKGNVLPNDLGVRAGGTDPDDNYRALALRAPLVLAGYGITGSGTQTHTGTDYRVHPETWKVGPLDVRWDDDKKIWQAGSASSYQLIRATYNGNNTATTAAAYDEVGPAGTTITVTDWLNGPLCSGQKVLIEKDVNTYYVVNAQYSAIPVVVDVYCDDETVQQTKTTIYVSAAYSQ